jgi:cytochrome c1
MPRWKTAGFSVLGLALASSLSFAAAAKTYQVTGPVLAVTDDTITVQKGTDRWEIARDASTKVTGDLKVGAKVTIEYRMSATSVDVKPDAAAKPAAKKPPAK